MIMSCVEISWHVFLIYLLDTKIINSADGECIIIITV